MIGQVVAADDRGKAAPACDCCQEAQALLGQPRADYQTRRHSLMRQVKEIEAKRTEEARAEREKNDGQDAEAITYEPIIVLVGQDEAVINIIIEGKYRQKNDFAYLTGSETPTAALILLPNQDKGTLYLPPVNPKSRTLEEQPDGPGWESAEKYGLGKVESTEVFLADLFLAIGDPRREVPGRSRVPVVYTFSKEGRLAMLAGDGQFVKFLREGAPTTEIKDLTPILAEMRKVKSCAELALLRKAIAITGAAQEQVVRSIRPGVVERELEAKVLATFTAQGSQRPGFPSIVGSGPNSTIPHYFTNQRTIEDGDVVVVDIGAECDYYTADITRTYPASGKFSARQREVYQLVLDAQKAAEARVKPGETKLREMTRWTREFLKESPLRAKDEDGNEHTMDHFFIHGLGHYLGMDVHDVGSTSKPLQPGEVITIEPGIYIPSENLGVRIEDDYLVTKTGVEKLSKAIPSEPDEIEALISAAKEKAGLDR
jgi:Xaa-Pro aminopeptidase